MKLFDSHIHIFERPYHDVFKNSHVKNGKKGEFTLFNEYREKFNVIGAFVIAYDDKRTPDNNRFTSELARKNKWMFTFGHVKRGRGNFLNQAKKNKKMGHFGASLYIDKDDSGDWLYSENMTPYWEFLKEHAVPMSINMEAVQAPAVSKVAERYPGQVFILSHMLRPIITDGKFNRKAYAPVLSLREFENIYIKLSGFYAFAQDGWRYPQRELFEILDLLKETFGVKRLIWGSDFSPVLEFNTYRQSFEVINTEYRGFSKEELERVFYRNSLNIARRKRR